MTRKQVSDELVRMRNGKSAIGCRLSQHVMSVIEGASASYSIKNMIIYAEWLGYGVFVHNKLMNEYYRVKSPMNFVEAVGILCKIHQTSIKEMSSDMKISYVYRPTESGPFPSIDMALRILDYFDCDISFIRKRPDLEIVVRNADMKIESA